MVKHTTHGADCLQNQQETTRTACCCPRGHVALVRVTCQLRPAAHMFQVVMHMGTAGAEFKKKNWRAFWDGASICDCPSQNRKSRLCHKRPAGSQRKGSEMTPTCAQCVHVQGAPSKPLTDGITRIWGLPISLCHDSLLSLVLDSKAWHDPRHNSIQQ